MTSTDRITLPEQPSDPAMFAPLTPDENKILGAHLSSGWYKQSAVYPMLSEPWQETAGLLDDLHNARAVRLRGQRRSHKASRGWPSRNRGPSCEPAPGASGNGDGRRGRPPRRRRHPGIFRPSGAAAEAHARWSRPTRTCKPRCMIPSHRPGGDPHGRHAPEPPDPRFPVWDPHSHPLDLLACWLCPWLGDPHWSGVPCVRTPDPEASL